MTASGGEPGLKTMPLGDSIHNVLHGKTRGDGASLRIVRNVLKMLPPGAIFRVFRTIALVDARNWSVS